MGCLNHPKFSFELRFPKQTRNLVGAEIVRRTGPAFFPATSRGFSFPRIPVWAASCNITCERFPKISHAEKSTKNGDEGDVQVVN